MDGKGGEPSVGGQAGLGEEAIGGEIFGFDRAGHAGARPPRAINLSAGGGFMPERPLPWAMVTILGVDLVQVFVAITIAAAT